MMFVLLAVLYVATSYMWYKIGFRSAAEAARTLLEKFLLVIIQQEAELETQKTPQDG